jgi:hypothetical protein
MRILNSVAAANVERNCVRMAPLPVVNRHAFAVPVYVAVANVDYIPPVAWRPGAFECG